MSKKLPKEVRKFLSDNGKKGGKKLATMYDMKARGAAGGKKAAANRKAKVVNTEAVK